MDIPAAVTNVMIAVAGLGLIAYLFRRLMRWARGRTSGAQVLGAVLTEITQAAVVQEAKQGNKREEGDAGDPPNTAASRSER
jgi:hypothetical protein